MLIKNQTRVVDLDDSGEWKVHCRTRGADLPGANNGAPVQTWILILVNNQGERRFIPERRLWEWYRLREA